MNKFYYYIQNEKGILEILNLMKTLIECLKVFIENKIKKIL
jgi:hypothetical protein